MADEPHKLINCCVCKRPYRIDCVKVSSSEARKIHSNAGFSWTCKNCIPLGNDINSLKSVIASLQEDIKNLKQSLKESSSSNSLSLLDSERIIQEIADRDRRKTNIIIFGCNETNCGSNNEQIALDTGLVNDMCSTLQVTDSNVKVSRLGKFDPTKTNRMRPIKVCFSSENYVHTVLRNVTKLKSKPKFSKVSIFRDRTPMQIEIHKNARAELANRLKNGESNLKIKYKNGIPSITSTLN